MPEQESSAAVGRTLDAGLCVDRCAYGECRAPRTTEGCGGCCGCLGGCQVEYEGQEVRRQYRVSDRRLVHICTDARNRSVPDA